MQDVPSLSSNDQESRSGEAMKEKTGGSGIPCRERFVVFVRYLSEQTFGGLNNDDSVKKANEVLDR